MDDELEMDSVENSLAVDTGAKAEVEARGSFSNTLGAVPSTPVVPVSAGRGEDRSRSRTPRPLQQPVSPVVDYFTGPQIKVKSELNFPFLTA